ncbi:esterase YqiA [Photobacterium piscicola]|uniref:Esterase YqiA n=1 Tax=Photobacterium piscicola TaxID=1378299 RepID=A0A1T5I3A4_9GAMM|nr:esterase YqiA [Photobacterium piscicola]MEC6899635.1 esterase YqiA [Photobacterium piscicola]SKC33608.1 esterase YqiA [Photobacterium piscicola]
MPSLLIYLHGFNSSPLSLKAQQMIAYCDEHRPDIKVVAPQLPSYPAEASQYLTQLIEQYQDHYTIGVVGSSLGGYLSAWLSECYQLPAVLVNPAVKPYQLLVDFLGPQQNPYSGEHYVLETQHIEQLKALEVLNITQPQLLWVLLQQGDEVLDYRQAALKYAHCRLTIEADGDHGFCDFERFPATIIQFLGL